MRRAALLLLLLAAGCTGTHEPEVPAVVAAADGGGVGFYLSSAWNRGETGGLGRWEVAGVRDLLAWGDRLYLLTEGRLVRYRTDGFAADSVPAEDEAREASWELDCPGRGLAAGDWDLIVVCEDGGVRRLGLLASESEESSAEDTADLAGFEALSFALYPDRRAGLDRLAYAYARSRGWHLEVAGDGGEPYLSLDRDQPEVVSATALGFFEGMGLGAAASGGGEGRVYLLGEELAELASAGVELHRVVGGGGVLAGFGRGFLLVSTEGGKASQTYTEYRAGWLHPDLYLYLAADERVEVLDVVALPELERRQVPVPGVVAIAGFPLE